MILRRSKQPAGPPPPPWRVTFDSAASMLRTNATAAWVDDRIAHVERALLDATADDAALATAIDQLEPDRTGRELKDALRRQRERGAVADPTIDATVRSLRQRYDTAHRLLNRRDDLAAATANALSDFEVLAIEAVGAGALSADDSSDRLDLHLERLGDDLAALRAAHDEVRSL